MKPFAFKTSACVLALASAGILTACGGSDSNDNSTPVAAVPPVVTAAALPVAKATCVGSRDSPATSR